MLHNLGQSQQSLYDEKEKNPNMLPTEHERGKRRKRNLKYLISLTSLTLLIMWFKI